MKIKREKSAAYRIAQFIFEQNDSPIDKYEFKNSDIYKKICNNSFPNLLVIQKLWLEDKKRYKNQIFRDDIVSINVAFEFGVQPRFLLALWGIETSFGK